MATAEVLQQGAKVFGWDKRNPVAGGIRKNDSSAGSAWACRSITAARWAITKANRLTRRLPPSRVRKIFSTELDLTADGNVTMKIALPDSGSNHATALGHLVAEMLGFTTRDHVKGWCGATPTSRL